MMDKSLHIGTNLENMDTNGTYNGSIQLNVGGIEDLRRGPT